VGALFTVLFDIFQDLQFVGTYTSENGSELLHFRWRLGDKEVEGVDMLHFDAQGLIDDYTGPPGVPYGRSSRTILSNSAPTIARTPSTSSRSMRSSVRRPAGPRARRARCLVQTHRRAGTPPQQRAARPPCKGGGARGGN
jgi:hypothetical protein